jgi:hypothetical protein
MDPIKDGLTHPDPLVDEVRAVRRGISERFGNDVNQLCAHLREVQRRYGGRVVTRRAKTALPAGPSATSPAA